MADTLCEINCIGVLALTPQFFLKQRSEMINVQTQLPTQNHKENTTMRFMMLMIPKGYDKAEPGAMPDAKALPR